MALILPSAVEPPEPSAWPTRSTVVVWVLMALIAVHFAVTRVVALDHARHWGLIDEQTFRALTYATTVWSLYPEPGLFAPWQLWTYALIHDGWLELALNLVILALAGRVVERWIGSAAFIGAVLTLAPLAAVIHLLVERDDAVLTGADGLAMGVMGMALALFPKARVQWGLAYYAVVVVGWLPLFRVGLPWVALAGLIGLVALRHGQLLPTTIADVGALAAGVVLGLAGRRIRTSGPG
jgi:membrane associated rhomboid family serine protease